ncbi:MAG: CHAP domain-containing protein [Spirochaetes bacterium]|nr:MAG: CHAP domain-containing protein [Spirochaetota bacterium]
MFQWIQDIFARLKTGGVRVDKPDQVVIQPPKKSRTRGEIIDALIRVAEKFVGEKETKGKNRSPLIDQIITDQNGTLGSPYCMYGMQHVIKLTCEYMGLKNPMPKGGGTQSVWAKIPWLYKSKTEPLKGDLIFFQSRGDKSRGHVGLVTEVLPNGKLLCVEWNTNAKGVRDGDGVWTKERSLKGNATLAVLGFADIATMILDANEG